MFLFIIIIVVYSCLIYLQHVTLSQTEAAGGDVDAFPRLNLDVINALVIVPVVHGVVGRQQDAAVLGNCRSAFGYGTQTDRSM